MCPAASVFSQHSLREALDHIYDSVPQLNLALVDSVVCGPILTITILITITHSTHQDKIKALYILLYLQHCCLQQRECPLSVFLKALKYILLYICVDILFAKSLRASRGLVVVVMLLTHYQL